MVHWIRFSFVNSSWVGSLNLEVTLTLTTLSMNKDSICLINVSMITRALMPVLMASIQVSKSLNFCLVDTLSWCLLGWSFG